MLTCTSTTAVHICQMMLVTELLGWCLACIKWMSSSIRTINFLFCKLPVKKLCILTIRVYRDTNFFHGLCSIIMESRLNNIFSVEGSYSNIIILFSKLGAKLNHSKIFKTAGLNLCCHFYLMTLQSIRNM